MDIIKKCSRCGHEPQLWHGYGDKDGNPLCDECVYKQMGGPKTTKR